MVKRTGPQDPIALQQQKKSLPPTPLSSFPLQASCQPPRNSQDSPSHCPPTHVIGSLPVWFEPSTTAECATIAIDQKEQGSHQSEEELEGRQAVKPIRIAATKCWAPLSLPPTPLSSFPLQASCRTPRNSQDSPSHCPPTHVIGSLPVWFEPSTTAECATIAIEHREPHSHHTETEL